MTQEAGLPGAATALAAEPPRAPEDGTRPICQPGQEQLETNSSFFPRGDLNVNLLAAPLGMWPVKSPQVNLG